MTHGWVACVAVWVPFIGHLLFAGWAKLKDDELAATAASYTETLFVVTLISTPIAGVLALVF